VSLSPHDVRLHPAPHTPARIERYELAVVPAEHRLNWQEDAYRNRVARIVFPEPTRELMLTVTLDAVLEAINPFDFLVAPDALQFPFAYGNEERRALAPFLAADTRGRRFEAWLQDLRRRLGGETRETIEFLVAVNQAVADDIHYTMRFEPGTQSCERTLELRSGSCRDSGWLLAQTLRAFGVATRFVSGYLVQLAGEGKQRTDSVALHAWCDAYVPGAGWIGLDATSGLLAAEHHVPLAVGAWPAATAPVDGRADASESKLSYEMSVKRTHCAPAKP
jgi:transglutaminase-like putative cysteine protease